MSFVTEVVKEFLNGCSNVSILEANYKRLELKIDTAKLELKYDYTDYKAELTLTKKGVSITSPLYNPTAEEVFKVYLLFNQELDNMLKDKRLAELLKEDRELDC